MGVTDKLTKRVGPLPVWGYGAAAIGGYLGYKLLTGGGNDDADTQYVATPTGAPQFDPSYPSAGAFEALRQRIEQVALMLPLPGQAPTPTPTPPADGGIPAPPVSNPKPAPKPPAKTPAAATTTRISRAEAAAISRRLGLDSAKVFGYGTKTNPGSFWVNNSNANYVWRSAGDFEAWLKRAYPQAKGAIGNPMAGQSSIPTGPNATSVKRETGGLIFARANREGSVTEQMGVDTALRLAPPPASVTPTRLPIPPIDIPFLAPTTRVHTMPVSAGPHTRTITVGERAHLFKDRFRNPFRG